MKRARIVFIFALTLPVAASAQTVTAGFKGGISLGWFSGSSWEDYIEFSEQYSGISISETPYLSFAGGGYLEMMFLENVGIVTEFSYARLGQSYEYAYYGYTFEGSFTQDVLQLPVLLKLSTGRRTGVFLSFGPAFNFLLGDFEFEESGAGVSVSDSVEPDNTTVVAFLIGAGVDVEEGPGKLTVEARYGRNLTDAFDVDPLDTNAFQAFVGYGVYVW